MRHYKKYSFVFFALMLGLQSAHGKPNIAPIISLLLDGQSLPIYQCKSSLLADIDGVNTTSSNTQRAQFTDLGKLTLFFAHSPATGTELWVTNGSAGGTRMLKDIYPGVKSGITVGLLTDKKMAQLGSNVYFLADDGVHGEELWISNGTPAGTKMVKDISASATASFVSNLTPYKGKMYFLVAHGKVGSDDEGLWVTDGSSAGTKLVKDTILNSILSQEPGTMAVLNDQLIFAARADDKGTELWKSNGTASGTSVLKDINPGGDASWPHEFAVVGNNLFFIADDGTHGREVWVSDGTASGTKITKDISPGSSDGAAVINIDYEIKPNPGFNNKLYFIGRTAAHGRELWVTDGSGAGTRLVKDIAAGSRSSFGNHFESADVFNGKFYFNADDDVRGAELWHVNANGSLGVQDLSPGAPNSSPSYITASKDYLYFQSRRQYQFGAEITIMDKQGRTRQLNINAGPASSNAKYLHVRNDQSLLFVTSNGQVAPGVGLYRLVCPAG